MSDETSSPGVGDDPEETKVSVPSRLSTKDRRFATDVVSDDEHSSAEDRRAERDSTRRVSANAPRAGGDKPPTVPPAVPPATTQPRSAPEPKAAAAAAGPRRVRLSISRIDPLSAMKLAFLLSVAIGIGIVVATAAVWQVLDSMGVFAQMISMVDELGAQEQFGPLLEYLEFRRVISFATVVAIVDVVLLTVLSTLGAFLYNIVAALVGGLHLTLTDD